MPRYKLVLEYDGGPFAGWQRQDNGPSVQAAIEDAVFKLAQERVTATGAGRTDAGVHARGQVAHFDLVKEFPADTVRDALNAHLRPAPVSVLEAFIAAPDFHARFPPSPATTNTACFAGARRPRWTAAMSGISDARSTWKRWLAQRGCCWERMISRPSAPPNVRRNRR